MINMTDVGSALRGSACRDRSFEYIDDAGPAGPLGEVLACLDGPLLVIDETLRILNANAQAFETLVCREDQSDFGRFIIGDTPARSQAMRRQAQTAVLNASPTVLMLRHPHHKRLICRLKGVRRPGQGGNQALVALVPLDQISLGVAPFLKEMYSLSPAEAEIALTASSGMEVSQMVVHRNVSIHTLRAQIASIKTKMGLSRMTEIAVAVTRIQATAALI
jgi:DNA-binding CsgD family transcriptional regulator